MIPSWCVLLLLFFSSQIQMEKIITKKKLEKFSGKNKYIFFKGKSIKKLKNYFDSPRRIQPRAYEKVKFKWPQYWSIHKNVQIFIYSLHTTLLSLSVFTPYTEQKERSKEIKYARKIYCHDKHPHNFFDYNYNKKNLFLF